MYARSARDDRAASMNPVAAHRKRANRAIIGEGTLARVAHHSTRPNWIKSARAAWRDRYVAGLLTAEGFAHD
jgi:hypothetical protein